MSEEDLSDFSPTPTIDRIASSVEDIDQEIVMEAPVLSKKDLCTPSTPLEDRWGRPRWVKTRMCYCLDSKVDSCNIVMRDKCPSEGLDKTQRNAGKWLWATNPEFNIAPVNEEGESLEVEQTSTDSGIIVVN